MSAPAEVVAAGDTVKIPFTAFDQYGNEITKEKDLRDVEFSGTFDGSLKFKADVNGDAYLEYVPSTKGTKVIIASFNGKVSQLNLNVVEGANPVTIEALKDVTNSVAKDGTVEIGLKNIVVKDEYGRTVDLKDKLTNTENEENAGKYRIVAKDANNSGGAVKVETKSIDANNAKIKLKGLATGSEDVTFTLQVVKKQSDGNYKFEYVATSPLKVSFSTVEKAAFETYEFEEIDTLYVDGKTHNRDLEVYGVKEDGSKVLLPNSYYTVITDENVKYENETGKLKSNINANNDEEVKKAFGNNNEITSTVTIVVDGAESPVTLKQDVVISKVKPKAETIDFTEVVKNGGATIAATKGTISATDLSGYLKVTDQYGVEIENPTLIITVTNLKDANPENSTKIDVENNGKNNAQVINAEIGDTFTATYLLDGKTTSIKFKVVEGEKESSDTSESD